MNEQAFFYVDGIPTKGIWIDLDDVSDWDDVRELLADANLIKRNEDDEPEYGGDILVADLEGDLPRCFYSSQFDHFDLAAYADCRDECDGRYNIDHDAAAAYISWTGAWSRSGFEDAYRGKYDSEVDCAEAFLEESGELDSIPKHLQCYFDYEAYARDLFINDLYSVDGHVFNRS